MKIIHGFLLTYILVSNVVAIADEAAEIVVYRSPTCSCCEKWLEHLQQNHFVIKDIVTNNIDAIKTKHGVTPELASCHTALIGGYVVEGHVPAGDIRALLKTKPEMTGIAVPGMPVGTPGMEMGERKDAYDVVSFDKQGHTRLFSSHKDTD
ncbi:MAG: DUF411 domain-containing protein [Methylovulum sp.]|nr:DUF411 domain-containing protein [Methylovulum sp.]